MTHDENSRAIHYDPADSLDEHGRLRVANAVVLSTRQCIIALVALAIVLGAVPRYWAAKLALDIDPNFRVHDRLSEDYWHVEQAAALAASRYPVVALGDSVIWGRFAHRDATLSAFINRQLDAPVVANLGLNGMQPATLRGLAYHYTGAVRDTRVLVNFNPLWIQDAFRDLSLTAFDDTRQAFQFNHRELTLHTLPAVRPTIKRYALTATLALPLPSFDVDFVPDIPLYRPDFEWVMSKQADRSVEFLSWVGHLQRTCYDGQSLQQWMNDNPRRNPFGPLTIALPEDDFRIDGEMEPGHAAPWIYRRGLREGDHVYDWVPIEQSHQWRAFRQTVEALQKRGNSVFVMVGPFNTHMLAEGNRAMYRRRLEAIELWLREHGISYIAPDALPSEMYADSSHPTKTGYDELARRLLANESFARWIDEACQQQ